MAGQNVTNSFMTRVGKPMPPDRGMRWPYFCFQPLES